MEYANVVGDIYFDWILYEGGVIRCQEEEEIWAEVDGKAEQIHSKNKKMPMKPYNADDHLGSLLGRWYYQKIQAYANKIILEVCNLKI